MKTLKFCIVIFSLLIIANSTFAQTSIKSIQIQFVSFYTTIDVNVDCEYFGQAFSEKKVKNVTNKLKDFDGFLKELKPSKNNIRPDVRAKIIIFRKNGIKDTLCFDGRNLGEYNGKPVVIGTNFQKYIKNIVGEK
ncbi:hypothetical protein GCM10023149_22170 [Mucilaginibacter gynuensis]|uniref:Uncharacterized protein n=1 Tax=Mucilaginibacter gynuensis TaxID=1302236 RepID=A0ABP8GD52_9SPHI